MDVRSLLRLDATRKYVSIFDSVSPQALADTQRWCALQELTAVAPETAETLYRRELLRSAGLMMTALRQRQIACSEQQPEWTRAMALLKEAYPDSLALLEWQLRTDELKPLHALHSLRSEKDRETMVEAVAFRRAELLEERIANSVQRPDEFFDGRLLHYVGVENLVDGASRYSSQGFFDHDDAPPWDTWVQHIEGTLVCWVPAVLIPLAQLGIDVNPAGCIAWAL